MRESENQRQILLAIGSMRGVQAWRTAAVGCYMRDAGGRYRLHLPLPVGWPDITCIVAGRAVAIEVKTEAQRRADGSVRLRPSQESMRRAWEAAGGVWLTATSAAEVVAVVEGLLRDAGAGGAGDEEVKP